MTPSASISRGQWGWLGSMYLPAKTVVAAAGSAGARTRVAARVAAANAEGTRSRVSAEATAAGGAAARGRRGRRERGGREEGGEVKANI